MIRQGQGREGLVQGVAGWQGFPVPLARNMLYLISLHLPRRKALPWGFSHGTASLFALQQRQTSQDDGFIERGWETAWWFLVLAALAEDLPTSGSQHTLQTVHSHLYLDLQGTHILFWALWTPSPTHAQTHTQTHTSMYEVKNKSF